MVKTQLDIKRAIIESGVSMAEVAERSGMDRSNVSKMWAEGANPTYNKLLAVANAIGKDITELFYPVDGSPVAQPKAESVAMSGESKTDTAKVGMIMCPHCHCGFEITGVVTPPTE